MSLPVYDYRTDVRNILVTPHIRSRFMRLDPGGTASFHSHDLGHEIFLVLEGRAEFTIDGETGEVGPGQMCIALVDQSHSVRTIGDDPMTMYLSVTPHIQPTHTGRTETGDRKPLRFSPNTAYDVDPDSAVSFDDRLDRHVRAARTVANAAQIAAQIQQTMADKLRQARASGDSEATEEARNTMWETLYTLYHEIYALADEWNDLAPRATE